MDGCESSILLISHWLLGAKWEEKEKWSFDFNFRFFLWSGFMSSSEFVLCVLVTFINICLVQFFFFFSSFFPLFFSKHTVPNEKPPNLTFLLSRIRSQKTATAPKKGKRTIAPRKTALVKARGITKVPFFPLLFPSSTQSRIQQKKTFPTHLSSRRGHGFYFTP